VRAARRALGLVVLAPLLGLAACGSSAPRTTTPDVFAGQPVRPVDARVNQGGVLYVADGCQACHSVDGSAKAGVSFRGLAARRSDRALLRAVVHHPPGTTRLAAVAALAHRPRDARELVDFIESVTAPG
jgi:mono/diheme cytochrome c family protein